MLLAPIDSPPTRLKSGERIKTAGITKIDVIPAIWVAIAKMEAVHVVADANRTPQTLGNIDCRERISGRPTGRETPTDE